MSMPGVSILNSMAGCSEGPGLWQSLTFLTLTNRPMTTSPGLATTHNRKHRMKVWDDTVGCHHQIGLDPYSAEEHNYCFTSTTGTYGLTQFGACYQTIWPDSRLMWVDVFEAFNVAAVDELY